MLKNIPKIIESDSEIQDKCSWWYNKNDQAVYRYNDVTESWELVSASAVDKQSIIQQAVLQSTTTSEAYSDQKDSELEEKIEEKVKTLEGKLYPTCRYARHGRIDLSNCKGVDYIVVPCNQKCQLLYVTNNYLKTFCEKTTWYDLIDKYELPVYGVRRGNVYDPKEGDTDETENVKNDPLYYVHYADWEDWRFGTSTLGCLKSDILKAFSWWYHNDKCLLTQYDRSKMPADEILNNQWYIYTKSITIRHNKMSRRLSATDGWIREQDQGIFTPEKRDNLPRDPLSAGIGRTSRVILHQIKTWKGINQFVYTNHRDLYVNEGYTMDNCWEEYYSKDMRYLRVDEETFKKYKEDTTKVCVMPALLTRYPHMIFKNPFRENVGGIIPVIDGKLRLEYAKKAINKKLLLVSDSNKIIEFDEKGVCKTVLNPNFYEIWTPLHAKHPQMFNWSYSVACEQKKKFKQYPRVGINWLKYQRQAEYLTVDSAFIKKSWYTSPDKPPYGEVLKFANAPYHVPGLRTSGKTQRRNTVDKMQDTSMYNYYSWLECDEFKVPYVGKKTAFWRKMLWNFTYYLGRQLKNVKGWLEMPLFNSRDDKLSLVSSVRHDDDGEELVSQNSRGAYNIPKTKYQALQEVSYFRYNFLFGHSDTMSMFKCNPYYEVNTMTLNFFPKYEYKYSKTGVITTSYNKKAFMSVKPGIWLD